jgi:hypothetical protein
MMEAVGTSETSVDIYLTTWQYIPEDSELHTRRHENLKSHIGRQCLITNYEWLNLITANHVSAQEKESDVSCSASHPYMGHCLLPKSCPVKDYSTLQICLH